MHCIDWSLSRDDNNFINTPLQTCIFIPWYDPRQIKFMGIYWYNNLAICFGMIFYYIIAQVGANFSP